MYKPFLIALPGLFICSNNAPADKIYLKSGKVLEGKLKEKHILIKI